LAGGGGFELLFFPDVIVVAVERDSGTEVSVNEVCGLGEDSKCVRDDRRKKCGAVCSANTDVIWIDGKRCELEAEREDALKECGLLGGEIHCAATRGENREIRLERNQWVLCCVERALRRWRRVA
jgi:hypothetical protein